MAMWISCIVMATSNPAPDRISAKRWKSCGRMRASTGHLRPAARWATLYRRGWWAPGTAGYLPTGRSPSGWWMPSLAWKSRSWSGSRTQEKRLWKMANRVRAGPSGCRSGRLIWCISTPTTILTQENLLLPKPTFSPLQGWTPGAWAPGSCVPQRPPGNWSPWITTICL